MTTEAPHTAKTLSGRQARLRDALRDNLKRRKLQARGRADQAGPRGADDSQNDAANGSSGNDDPGVGGARR